MADDRAYYTIIRHLLSIILYICRMRPVLFLLLIIFFSCNSPSEKDKIHNDITGNWFVLSEDHDLEDGNQTRIFGAIQDSLIAGKCLKLVVFAEDGSFQQLDAPDAKGRWAVSPAQELYVAQGGKGFETYKTKIISYHDKILDLSEIIHVEGETIKLTWSLKKMNSNSLFTDKRNTWRKRSTHPETGAELKQKLAMMLNYYSDYYELVNKEVSYFIPSRIMMPLKFYQHAMGVVPLDPESDFAKFFYNKEQSEEAYGYLKKTVYKLGNLFPEEGDYVDEYAAYMKIVAKELEKEM
jgi:hypothetical protein